MTGKDQGAGNGFTSRLKSAAAALQVRSFRWWFLSQILSASGTMTQGIAQSWLVLKLTDSAFLLALSATVTMAPILLASAAAGSLIDRFDRRRVLLVTQSLFLLLGTGLGLLVATGAVQVWMLFAFGFLNGCVSAVDQPARQVFVVDLVGRDRIANAVAINEIVLNTSRVLGPSVGAVLLATVGVAACFLVNAASYLPPLVVVLGLLRRRGWQPQARVARNPGRIRQGLVFVWRRPAIRCALVLAVASGMLFNMGTTLPLLAARTFHVGGGGYGTLMATFGGGALFGALMAGSGPAWPSARRVRLLAGLTGSVICLAAAAPFVSLLFAGLAVVGFLSIWFIAVANTLVQLRTEPELRGRVMGLWTMALPGMNPLTSLLVGGVAAWVGGSLGARLAFSLAGIALVTITALGWRALSDRQATLLPVARAAGRSSSP